MINYLDLKYWIVSFNPEFNEIFGSQLNILEAKEISGFLLLGSSWGKSLKDMSELELVSLIINVAKL